VAARHIPLPLCWICGKEVYLEESKTDENGNAVHEECYTLRTQLEHGSSLPEPQLTSEQKKTFVIVVSRVLGNNEGNG
jgi:hypothetical protein